MKRLAILLATEEYRNFRPTAFCFNDLDTLRNALVDYCDFAPQDILSRKLDINFTDSPATLIEEMKGLLRKAQPGDLVLFYYAGHGAYRDGDSYLVLPNTEPSLFATTAVPLRDVSDTFRNPELVNIRLFDSCHSGQDVRSPDADELNQEDFTRDILSGKSQGWMTFAACRDNELSYSDPSLQNGVFTYFLADSLRTYSEGEVIYPETLKLRVCDKVYDWAEKNGKKQTPTFNSSISGNVTFATRTTRSASLGVPPSASLSETLPVAEKSSRDVILDRLAKARGIGIVTAIDLFKAQTDAFADLESYIEKKKFEQFGKLERDFIQSEVSIDRLTYHQKVSICHAFEESKLQTRYRISIDRTYEEPEPQNDLFGMSNILGSFYDFGRKKARRLVSTAYNVSKSYEEPEGYIETVAIGDELVPTIAIWFILVPCLTRIACCYGYRLRYESENRQVDSSTAEPFIIPNSDRINWASVLDVPLNSLETKMFSSMTKQISKKLDYFELENKELYEK
jgi:hypothetical protein